jgi:hypothetical protein
MSIFINNLWYTWRAAPASASGSAGHAPCYTCRRLRRRNPDGEPRHAPCLSQIAHTLFSKHWAGPVIERATWRHDTRLDAAAPARRAWSEGQRPRRRYWMDHVRMCNRVPSRACSYGGMGQHRDGSGAAEHRRVIRPIPSTPPGRALQGGVSATVACHALPPPARRDGSRHAAEEQAPG